MTRTDTGPLVAIIDEDDDHHFSAATIAPRISWPIVTSEACITEATYLLGQSTGWRGQAALGRFIADGSLRVLAMQADGPARAFAFIERFRDQPCDYADASLLVMAEDTGLRKIFTFDKHLYAYRLLNGSALEVIQSPTL